MPHYIDADFLISEIRKYNKENWHGMTWSSNMVCSLLRKAPKVDAVEVVRCKNCRYFIFDKVVNAYLCVGRGGMQEQTDNSFCSYGKKREE